jgi:hypothetical protein
MREGVINPRSPVTTITILDETPSPISGNPSKTVDFGES